MNRFQRFIYKLFFTKKQREMIERAVIYSAYKYKMHGQMEEYEEMNAFSNSLR